MPTSSRSRPHRSTVTFPGFSIAPTNALRLSNRFANRCGPSLFGGFGGEELLTWKRTAKNNKAIDNPRPVLPT